MILATPAVGPRPPGKRLARLALLFLFGAPVACSSSSHGGGTANAARGGELFRSSELSSSQLNIFTCATCHETAAPGASPAVIKSGAVLAGVTRRSSFWGGMEVDLLDAINDCRLYFMSDRDELARDDSRAEALYAYFLTLEPGDAAPVAFTVPSTIENVSRGSADAGGTLFPSACGSCHGELHTGAGRLAPLVPVLPEDALASHATYDIPTQRLIFIEKVRHGGFFGYSGMMPPFSKEALSDAALGDLLEALGVTGVPPASTGGTP
jgi:thiosulfate dehydrogenase